MKMKKFGIIIAVVLLAAILFGTLEMAVAPSAQAESMSVYVNGNNVRERTAPNTDAKIVRNHFRGEIVQVVGVEGDWAQLENGHWMAKKYLTTDEAKVFYDLPMYVIGTGVRERTTASTSSDNNIARTHSIGDVVRVAAKLDGWYLLMNGNYIRGDMLSADIMVLAEQAANRFTDILIVSKRMQYARYYYNGEVYGQGSCVTGDSEDSPTPSGLFTVTKRKTDFNMNDNPDNYVAYAVYFNGHIAAHDADHWRHGNYGGTIYKGHGSHGCVNLPREFSRVVWYYSRVGRTMVLVLGDD